MLERLICSGTKRSVEGGLKTVFKLFCVLFDILSLDKASGLLDPVKLTVNTNAVVGERDKSSKKIHAYLFTLGGAESAGIKPLDEPV